MDNKAYLFSALLKILLLILILKLKQNVFFEVFLNINKTKIFDKKEKIKYKCK